MGKTAEMTSGQKAIIDTLHRMGKPQKFIAKEAGCSQSAVSKHINGRMERTVDFSGLSNREDSRIWQRSRKSGMR